MAARLPTLHSRRHWLATAIALGAGLAGCASPPATGNAQASIAPFSSCPQGLPFPGEWAPYVLRRDLPRTDYEVADVGDRRVLRARGHGSSSGLRHALQADARQTPWLRWDWRVDEVPPDMSVRNPDTDDSPARMVVSFDGDAADLPLKDRAFFDLVELLTGQRLPYATLMYVWDAQLPVGALLSYARTSRIRYLVVESGAARAGRWLAQERHLQADFHRAFGEPAGRITSVGVLTDSDDLKVQVGAWYGDIRLEAV